MENFRLYIKVRAWTGDPLLRLKAYGKLNYKIELNAAPPTLFGRAGQSL
jgi:hypothetical protein